MSQLSVIRAVIALLDETFPGEFKTIEDVDTAVPAIPPDRAPAARLQYTTVTERALAYGYDQAEGDLDVHIWRYDRDRNMPDKEDFKDWIERIARMFRDEPHFDCRADVAGKSQVLISGRRMKLIYSRPRAAAGMIVRHGLISTRVVEGIILGGLPG